MLATSLRESARGARFASRLRVLIRQLAPLLSALASGCATDSPDQSGGFGSQVARLEPEARVDGNVELFPRIYTGATRGDGAIAILLAEEVRLYSENGTALESFGRRGAGPGEFTAPVALGWKADTLWVYDAALRRIVYASPNLLHLRTEQVNVSAYAPSPEVRDHPDLADPRPRALSPDGKIYAVVQNGDGLAIGKVNIQDGSKGHIISIPPAEDAAVAIPSGGVALPFANLPKFAVSSGGDRTAVAKASVVGPEGGTFLLTVADAEGQIIVSRRYPFDAHRLTPEAAEVIVNRWSEFGRGIPGAEAAIRQNLRIPDFLPPLNGVVMGSDSTIWIGATSPLERSLSDSELQRWYVVAASGEPIGTLRLPYRSRLLTAERSRIWVVELDDLDVESVFRYSVHWD